MKESVVGPEGGEKGVVVDIGANAGFYTFWALSLRRPGMAVIAVEPTDVMLARIRFNLTQNGLEGAVSIFPCAVTPEACEVVIEEHSGSIGQTSVKAQGRGRKVAGRPLTDLLAEAGVRKVDAMKIDIEGFEVPVLEAFFANAPWTLWPKMIVCEIVGKDGNSLKELLLAKGYRIERCTKMNGILSLG